MRSTETIVSPNFPLTEQQLHAKIMRGWQRAIDKLGKGAFADKLGISETGLNKQLTGSFPGASLLDKALSIEPTVLDDWFASHNIRLVDRDAVCDTDDVSILVSRLLNKLVEAQHPDSPGGRRIVGPEILAMDDLLREVVRVASSLLDQGAAYRGDNVRQMRGAA